MTKIPDVLTKYFHGNDQKILDGVAGATDEVFTPKELAKMCGTTPGRASEVARWLSRSSNKLSMTKIKNLTYYGMPETISKLDGLVAGTRIIRKREVIK